MRAFTALALVASLLGLASAQEAARFGAVDVSPSTVKLGQEFTVKYNSTTARRQPKTLDVFVQGTFANGNKQPMYQLLRSNFTSTNHIVEFNATLPIASRTDPSQGYQEGSSYLVWAYLTYTVDDEPNSPITIGGTSAPLSVDLN